MSKVKIGFFVRQFSETGTEVATYDYADYNEKILGNESVILSFSENTHSQYNFPFKKDVFEKFKKRFQVLQVDTFSEMPQLLDRENIDIYYLMAWGIPEEPPYGDITNKKYAVHCVFDTRFKRGNAYVAVSDQLNKKFNTQVPVVPHMIRVGETNHDLREVLNIPSNATVFGRYGGYTNFDIQAAKDAVVEVAQKNKNIYFLFANTQPFVSNLPNVIFLPQIIAIEHKKAFINTCNAYLHGRTHGETFGLSIGEFAVCLKPIICCGNQFMDWAHLDTLGDKAITYNSKEELIDTLTQFKSNQYDMTNNGYLKYTPEKVMQIFKQNIIDECTL